jgi:hypothetical protein
MKFNGHPVTLLTPEKLRQRFAITTTKMSGKP